MSVFVESVDVDAAWEVYYQLADRRHKDGLTFEELRQVIDAALVGKAELDMEAAQDLLNAEMRYYGIDFEFSEQQAEAIVVSPWVEVEEVT